MTDALINTIIKATRVVTGPGEHNLHVPDLTDYEREMVSRCFDEGFVSSMGEMIPLFEDQIKNYTGAQHAVAMASGTAALHIALVTVGVKPEDEVLVPALTFVATGHAILYTGATPHFIESHPHGFGLDIEALRAHLEKISRINDNGECINTQTGRVIRALVPVHIFGHLNQPEALRSLANDFGLIMVEDAAEALGSWSSGTHAGLFGHAGILSFNGNKTITTGGGGCLITMDDKIAKLARHLSTTAKQPHRYDYYHDQIGYNYRMNNLNAGLGVAQMDRLDALLEDKKRLRNSYAASFDGIEGLRFYTHDDDTTSNYWLQTLLLDKTDLDKRNAILDNLHDNGLFMRPIWRLLNTLPAFSGCPSMTLNTAQILTHCIINLPSSSALGRR